MARAKTVCDVDIPAAISSTEVFKWARDRMEKERADARYWAERNEDHQELKEEQAELAAFGSVVECDACGGTKFRMEYTSGINLHWERYNVMEGLGSGIIPIKVAHLAVTCDVCGKSTQTRTKKGEEERVRKAAD